MWMRVKSLRWRRLVGSHAPKSSHDSLKLCVNLNLQFHIREFSVFPNAHSRNAATKKGDKQ